jgi:exodeoxyribonuclease V gamma subunit
MQNLSSLAQPVFDWLSEKETIEAFIPPIGLNLLSSMKVALYDLSPFEKEGLKEDDSLQIHEAPSKLREVEILLENLKTLYEKAPFSFDDVIVLAPNMESYHPYIKLVFTNDPIFGFFSDAPQSKPILPLFFDFIESRFEPSLLFTLLDSPHFQKQTPFSEEEIDFFRSLVEEKGIDWGFNLQMRQEILGENNLSSRGSWCFAFDNIIQSLPFSSSNIEISKFELLGEWISFIQKLHLDLYTFKKGSHSIFEWIEITSSLLDTYFERFEERESLKKELRKLFEVGSFVKEEFFYPSIKQVIDSYFKEKKESLSCPIRFSSITDPAIPSVAILCVLGLDEESFPRRPSHSSINQLKKAKGVDHQPEIGEKDRYFFIQTILSAKNHLIFSFVNRSPLDGKELYPSPLLKELPTKITSHSPLPPFYKKEDSLPSLSPSIPKEPTEISYKSLMKLMKHPLQFYANEVAGIYFESREEETKKKNSEFFLSYQDRAILSSKLLRKEAKELLKEIDHNNLLPTALFKEVAETEIEERLEEMKEHYQSLGIDKEEIFSLLLHPSIEKLSFLNEELWTAPTIPIPLSPDRSIILYGKIDFLTPKGVLINGEDCFEELWKALPTLYLVAHLFKEIPQTLLFAKSGTKKSFSIEDPLTSLTSLINYYLAAYKTPSPLMPNRVESLFKGDVEKFLLLAEKKESFFQDPYLIQITPDLSFPWKDHLPIIPI